jgi:hypothetical protein
VNLNYVVIIDSLNLYVYSLQALRNPLQSDAFVFKIERQWEIGKWEIAGAAVDDTQIVFVSQRLNGQKITVLDFGSFDPTPLIAYREQSYVVCPAEKRFLLLFSFLKRNRKTKIMVFFSSCMSVKFHHELLNYMDIPVMCIHVSISLLDIFCNLKQSPIEKLMYLLTLMYLYFYRGSRSKPSDRQLSFSSVMLNRASYCARMVRLVNWKSRQWIGSSNTILLMITMSIFVVLNMQFVARFC